MWIRLLAHPCLLHSRDKHDIINVHSYICKVWSLIRKVLSRICIYCWNIRTMEWYLLKMTNEMTTLKRHWHTYQQCITIVSRNFRICGPCRLLPISTIWALQKVAWTYIASLCIVIKIVMCPLFVIFVCFGYPFATNTWHVYAHTKMSDWSHCYRKRECFVQWHEILGFSSFIANNDAVNHCVAHGLNHYSVRIAWRRSRQPIKLGALQNCKMGYCLKLLKQSRMNALFGRKQLRIRHKVNTATRGLQERTRKVGREPYAQVSQIILLIVIW